MARALAEAAGLPIGVQVVAAREDVVMRIIRELEEKYRL
jgi:hypothetical protein